MAESQDRHLRVFLCHSSNDKLTVRELYRQLSNEDWIDLWLDEENLFPGMDWNLEIEKAVEAADAILVCISNGSITKEGYVQRELRIVLDYADYKPEGSLYIFPVRLEACELPRRLRHLQYADYFPPGNRGRAFGRLLVGLRNRAKVLGIMAGAVEERRGIDRNRIGDHQAHRGNVSYFPEDKPRSDLPETIQKDEERHLYSKQVVTMSRPTYDQILDYAKKHFPNMAAGFLFGKDNHIMKVSPYPNIERTNPRAKFLISPESYLEAELVADNQGLEIIGMFYSQDQDASISGNTRSWAQPFWVYLVVGLGTHPPSRRAYKLTEESRGLD